MLKEKEDKEERVEFFGGMITFNKWVSPLPIIGLFLFVYFVFMGKIPWELFLVIVLIKMDFLKVNISKLFNKE